MFRRLTGFGIAGIAGLLVVAGVLSKPLAAADLPYEGDRYGSAYDDPRYADIYGRGAPQPRTYTYRVPEPPAYDRYEERPPIPREPVYREDYPKYGSRAPYYDGHARRSGCPSQNQIRADLERRGWNDFHSPRVLDSGAALVRARRPSGRLFELMLDRCDGHIMEARPLEPRRFGPYAERYGSRW